MKMSTSAQKPVFIIVSLLLFSYYNPLYAETRTWTGGTGENKNWGFPGNWGGTIPAQGDDILFNTPGSISFAPNTLPLHLSFFNSISIFQSSVKFSGGDVIRYFIIGGNTGPDLIIATNAALTIEKGMSIYLGSTGTASIDGTLEVGMNSLYNTDQAGAVTSVSGIFKAGFLGSLICTDRSRLLFSTNSTYIHNKPDGKIPSATWASNAGCRILTGGGQSLSITGFNQRFGNLIFETGQFDNFNIDAPLDIAGDLSVITTGSGSISVRNNGGPGTINVGGNYIQTGGYFKLSSGINGLNMTVAGNFSMSGFTRHFSFGEGTSNSTVSVSGNTSINKGVLLLSNGISTGTFNVGGELTLAGGTITELSTGKGDIIFNGSATQVFYPDGGLFQNSVNFTIDNPLGVTFSGTATLPGTLTLNRGVLTIPPGKTLKLIKGDAINGPGFNATRHIATQVNNSTGASGFLEIHNFGKLIPFLFPVGDGTNYLPITLTSDKANNRNKFKVCTFQGITRTGLPDGIPLTAIETDKCVNAVWNLLYTGPAGHFPQPIHLTLDAGWPATLEGTGFAAADNGLIGISQIETGGWGAFSGVGNNLTNTATRSNILTFTSYIVGLRNAIPL